MTNHALPWRAEGQFVIRADGRSVCRVNGMPSDAEVIAKAVNALAWYAEEFKNNYIGDRAREAMGDSDG